MARDLKKPVAILMFIAWVCAPQVYGAVKKRPMPVPNKKAHAIEPNSSQLSLDAVFHQICRVGISFPRVVMQQAILETGWLKSKQLMSINNLFGFKTRRYLRYKNWESSIDSYLVWQRKRLRMEDKDYYHFLDRIGYGAPGYTALLRKVNWRKDCSSAWHQYYEFDQIDEAIMRIDDVIEPGELS